MQKQNGGKRFLIQILFFLKVIVVVRVCIYLQAGKPIGNPYENVRSLLQEVKLQEKIDVLTRGFCELDAESYGVELKKGPGLDTSGAFTEIRHCIRPPVLSPFKALNDEIENTIYDSYWNKPLGKSRDPTPGLPAGMDIYNTTFGKPTIRTDPDNCIINPKPPEMVEYEEKACHDLYVFTHNNYFSGEQIRRK